jgi:universal stress protein E
MAQQWKSVVVVISDPHRAQQTALAKAADIAAECDARLTLLNTFMVPNPPPGSKAVSSRDVLSATIAERKERLERLARPLRKRGIKAICIVEWDFPAHEAIVRHLLKSKTDLLVAESHRHNPVARVFLANTDWELIRACPCPLWFVRSRSLPKSPKVLVAVDPRHTHAKPAQLDDRLLSAAKQLVKQLGGNVHLVHVYEPLASGSTLMEPIRLPMSSRRAREFDAATKKAVDHLAARYSIKPANRILQTGDAVHAIPAIAAKLKANVLVMGAVSRSRLERPFIGNTAEKVIDHVDCDVLVVKPANFKTLVKRTRARL